MSKPKKLQYNGSSKVIQYIVTCVNWLLDNGGGGSGSNVTVTPTVTTGTKIAEISVDDTVSELYAPDNQQPFDFVIDETDGGINIVYDDSILN